MDKETIKRLFKIGRRKPQGLPKVPANRVVTVPNTIEHEPPPKQAVKTELPLFYQWIIEECKRTSKPRTILN